MSTHTPTSFTIAIPDADVARLQRMLTDARLPAADTPGGTGWTYGLDLAWAADMRARWLAFDWRAAEREMNKFPNFKVDIEDISLHFVHARSAHPHAIPLVIIHGWPGSFYEFYGVVERLRAPADAAAPAFHVVLVSMPGFAFSSALRRTGWDVGDTARVVDTLMGDVLRYPAYMAQGGDWGSMVATHLALRPRCRAVHLNMCVVAPPYAPLWGALWGAPRWLSGPLGRWLLSDAERAALARSKAFAFRASYYAVHALQPLALGAALVDSPIGLLAWIGSKYYELVDPAAPFPTDVLCATLALYFHTGSAASSLLPYADNALTAPLPRIGAHARLAVSTFAYDVFVVPRAWVRSYHGEALVFHRTHERGGHFPALDNPEALVQDLQDFASQQAGLFVEASQAQ